ncbi:MAG: hypothetical protein IAG13_30030, partial [Deltaproteobacteria bacterium]|nr:hypothetical protein [Nannocystaceae bacterium]
MSDVQSPPGVAAAGATPTSTPTPSSERSPIRIEPPPGGFDRAGVRALVAEGALAKNLHKVVRAPFGH